MAPPGKRGRKVESATARIVGEYERQFARLFQDGVSALAFWKGRVALHAILEALGVGSGSEVIVPGFTCVVVPNAVQYLGGRPVYADIEAGTFHTTRRTMEAKLTSRTRAIVVQHTFGIPEDMEDILALGREAGIPVVEDCAHALGSRYKGRLVGTLGQAAFFSSQWSKPYSTGLGGMAVTADASLAEHMADVQASYEWPGRVVSGILGIQVLMHRFLFRPRLYWIALAILRRLSTLGLFVGSSDREELTGSRPSHYTTRMSGLQAFWGLREVSRFSANASTRQHLGRLYDGLLGEAGFAPLRIPPNTEPVLVRYPLLVKNKSEVLERARVQRVEIGSWFECVLHPAGSPLEKAYYTPGECPVGEAVCERVINLPVHPGVTGAEAARVVKFLQEMREHCLA